MSLDYAANQFFAAVRSLASSEDPLQTRLQTVWDESVQLVWEKPCLTPELLAHFKALWDRFTDKTAAARSTTLRPLTTPEAVTAIEDLLALAFDTAVTAAQAPADITLATLADLA
jgi:hypothetical protein